MPPFTRIWAIRPIPPWLCTVTPVGMSHGEKDNFPLSPQQETLSQTWTLSRPDLTLKWACKEYVLEREAKTTVLKNPQQGNSISICAFNYRRFLLTFSCSQIIPQIAVCGNSCVLIHHLCYFFLMIDSCCLCQIFPHASGPYSAASGISIKLELCFLIALFIFSFKGREFIYLFSVPAQKTTRRQMPQSLRCRIWRGVCL